MHTQKSPLGAYLTITQTPQISQVIRRRYHRRFPTFHHVIAILLQALYRCFKSMDPTKKFDGVRQRRFAVENGMQEPHEKPKRSGLVNQGDEGIKSVLLSYPCACNASDMSFQSSCKSEAANVMFRAASVKASTQCVLAVWIAAC